MSARTAFSHVASFSTGKFIDLLFPTVCASCGRIGPVICAGCRAEFQAVQEPICLRCGRHSPVATTSCPACAKLGFKITFCRACFNYSEPLVTIIHRLKYEGLFALASPLGLEMANNWPDWPAMPDLILPVPLHPRRRRARGFNQSLLLAEHLGPATAIPVRSDILRRVRHTKPQIGLNPAQRAQNVSGAFATSPTAVRGRHILLIDDVFTTGATMLAAAETLLGAGASRVSAYCLARAVH